MKYDLIIIGSGSVGAAAGYYATRAGLNVLMRKRGCFLPFELCGM